MRGVVGGVGLACLLGNTVFHKTKTAMGRPLTTTLAGVFFGNMFLSCAVVLVVVYGLLLAVGLQWAVWPLIAAYAVNLVLGQFVFRTHVTGTQTSAAFRRSGLWAGILQYFSATHEIHCQLEDGKQYIIGISSGRTFWAHSLALPLPLCRGCRHRRHVKTSLYM